MRRGLDARAWLLVILGVATFGVFGLVPLVHLYGRKDRARKAAAVVLLGARVWPGGQPSPSLRARAAHAAALYARGLSPLLVLSGGVGDHPPSEAQVALGLLRQQGVPEAACLLEEQSRTTRENARFCAALLSSRGVREVVLVSDGFHLFRAVREFRRAGLKPLPSPAPLEGRALTRLDVLYWTTREAFGLLLSPWLLWA